MSHPGLLGVGHTLGRMTARVVADVGEKVERGECAPTSGDHFVEIEVHEIIPRSATAEPQPGGDFGRRQQWESIRCRRVFNLRSVFHRNDYTQPTDCLPASPTPAELSP